MKQAVADVIEFMRAMNQDVSETPRVASDGVRRLRDDLIEEERRELVNALHDDDLPEIADACADLIYVVIGTALAYGVDLDEVWRRVHAANMTKASGPVLPNGKRGKPPGFQPPDIAAVLADQRPLSELYPPKGA